MSQCYATVRPATTTEPNLGLSLLRAASQMIDNKLAQRGLLAYPRTERELVIGSTFIQLPMPGEITTVALAGAGVRLPDEVTADSALTLAGVVLVINEADLVLGAPRVEATQPLYYQRLSGTVLRLLGGAVGSLPPLYPGGWSGYEARERPLALVDGVFGWGEARSLHGAGTWGKLEIGVSTVTQETTAAALAIGSTLRWDRESLVIAGVETAAGPPQVHTYTVQRDNEQAHDTSDELYLVTPPENLELATRTVAAWYGQRAGQPFSDSSVMRLWETVMPLLGEYGRPSSA